MEKYRIFLLLIFVIATGNILYAQTKQENTGWLASFNSYKLSTHWGLHFDAQFRSADDWHYVRNVLIRPGIMYHFNPKNNVTAGYAYIGTINKAGETTVTFNEHRIWEQYINNQKFKQVSLQNRFRLEQRFIERANEDVFAQRLRYFVRSVIPLAKQKSTFNKGVFAALQNELFFNVQNKAKINNSVFDQNRAYGAIGYRVNAKFDVEAGYMNQYIKGAAANTSNNVVQLAFYTRL